MKEPRILLFDIETAPNLGYTWGKYEQNVIDFKKGWYILCFAYKWLDEKTVHTVALPDFAHYKKDREDDEKVVGAMWKLFDEADVLVAHNGDQFDIKKMNSRFIVHHLEPPSPYKTIDTLKWARRIGAFNSNKLDDLAAVFEVGRKLPHTGKHLWLSCMSGDMKAWKLMRDYNAQDVRLLEKVYLRLRAWAPTAVNLNLIHGRPNACPRCQSTQIHKRGGQYFYSLKSAVQMYRCMDCGHSIRGERVPLDNPVKFH